MKHPTGTQAVSNGAMSFLKGRSRVLLDAGMSYGLSVFFPAAARTGSNLTLGLLRLKNANSIKETTEWICRDRTRALQFMTT